MQSDERLDALARSLHSPPIIFTQCVFFTLTISGGLLLVLVLSTFALASAGAARNAALSNFLIGLTIGMALGPALLPLSGHAQTPQPPRSLCFLQIGIVQGGVAMCSVAAVAIVVHLAATLPGKRTPPRWLRLLTSALPGTAFVVYVLAQAEAAFAMGDRLTLERGVLLCRFAHGSPFFFKKGPMVGILASLVIVIVASVYLAVRIRDKLRLVGLCNLSELMNDESERGLWISLLLRVMLFELVCILGAILVSVDTLGHLRKDGPVHLALLLVSGTMPLFAFLIFGTVPSLRKIWYNWVQTLSGRKKAVDSKEEADDTQSAQAVA